MVIFGRRGHLDDARRGEMNARRGEMNAESREMDSKARVVIAVSLIIYWYYY